MLAVLNSVFFPFLVHSFLIFSFSVSLYSGSYEEDRDGFILQQIPNRALHAELQHLWIW